MRNATLRQLRMFAAAVRTGSVTGAADALHVTPPAVTMQLRQLQDQVGLTLIERSPSGMVATDAGRRLVDAVDRIEAILAECGAALAGLAGAKQGTVAVGVISTAKYFAPRALAAFAEANPGIGLRLAVGNRAEMFDKLRRYELDLVITGRPPQEMEVVTSEIGPHPHVVVARPDHRLSDARTIPARLLESENFLVREPGSGTRGLMERFFADSGIAPHFGMEIGSNETIKQAVIAGLGIAFLSAHTIEAEVADDRLTVLPVEGLPVVRVWYTVHLRERHLMPAADALRAFLAARGRQFLPGTGLLLSQSDAPRPARNAPMR